MMAETKSKPSVVVEIFDRKTKKVADTKTFTDQKAYDAFAFYWDRQCDTKNYSWRVVKTTS